jgi:hypothetical protein
MKNEQKSERKGVNRNRKISSLNSMTEHVQLKITNTMVGVNGACGELNSKNTMHK